MIDFKADRKIRDHSGKTATSYLKNVVTSTVELKKTIARNYSLDPPFVQNKKGKWFPTEPRAQWPPA